MPRQAEAVHADHTPARVGGILPGYRGILVRDGCHTGYGHPADALHAWRGARLLRGLTGLYELEPGKQDWAGRWPPS
jgi:hypothetical protein